MPCQHTSFIESITISWKSPTGCSSLTTAGSGFALDFIVDARHARRFGECVLVHQVALEDIQHLGTTLEIGRKFMFVSEKSTLTTRSTPFTCRCMAAQLPKSLEASFSGKAVSSRRGIKR